MKDWTLARADYIRNPVTLQYIATKYHMGVSTVWTRAAKEGWGKEREKYNRQKEKMVERSIEKNLKKEISSIMFDEKSRLEAYKGIISENIEILRTNICPNGEILQVKSRETLTNSTSELEKLIALREGGYTGRIEITSDEKRERILKLKERVQEIEIIAHDA